MPLETRNELFSTIGIDMPFIHSLPVVTGLALSLSDVQSVIHKSIAVLFSTAAAVAAAVSKFYTAAPNKSHWTRTGFGSG